MNTALCAGLVLSFAGHTDTHTAQPVQSSGATCTVYRPWRSCDLYGTCLKVGGAEATAASSYTFTRIAACGQTIAHLLHWMQSTSSHTGISVAMLRFSHFDVPVGQVPSAGNALTGRRSPSLAIMMPVTRFTKSVASCGTGGGT